MRCGSLPLQKMWLSIVLIFALLSSDALHILTEAKRGGGGGGFGRGGSAGRSSGGIFGGRSGGSRTGSSGGMSGGGYNNRNSGSSGGIFGSSSNHRSSGGYGKYTNSRYNKGSGVGSMARSSTFKNMIVGAAAGYLTYQAGKAIIRNTMSPMMWGGRPYYWGQSYYQGRPNENMCRMPLEGDSQFNNVYFQDNSRPKEIVWSCRYDEHCCGYECCPSSTGNYGYGYRGGIGLGSIIVLLLLCGCGAFVIHQVCKARRSGHGASFFSSNSKYSPGQAAYTANEPPPQYSASGNAGGAANFNYPPPPQPPPPGFVYS